MRYDSGMLFYDGGDDGINRLDIEYPDGTRYGGLRCGACIEILSGAVGAWLPVRIEYSSSIPGGWYAIADDDSRYYRRDIDGRTARFNRAVYE